ncbi:MAG TPA: hypothetical protein VK209_07860 [Candidatus Sulfotelmatobacter sp.]|nr:hypothetical protein [Candidatus Sulfotelmatobacter sp.]
MGFAGFIGGALLGIFAVLLAIFGIAILLGFFGFLFEAFLVIPLGIIILIVALILFAYGWYLYKSSKPKGTVNVHND